MPRKLYGTFPVKALQRSFDFFTVLDFSFDLELASENGAAKIINDSTNVILSTEPFFATLSMVPITDPRMATEALSSRSQDSRTEVEELVRKAIAAGADLGHEPEISGFMYSRAFVDPDGTQWGLFHMDLTHLPPQ